MKKENKIEAIGRIVGIKNSPQGYGLITLKVSSGKKDTFADMILENPLPADIGHGNIVKVEGRVRGAVRFLTENGTPDTRQYLIAETVTPANTMITERFGIKGGSYFPDQYFKVYLMGSYVKATDTGNGFCRLTVDTGSDYGKAINNINLSYFTVGYMPRPNNLKKGDNLAIVARLQTTTKTVNGKTRKYETMIAEDCVVVK